MRGLFFATTLPLWEGFDEPAHFGVIDFVARNHAWPKEDAALPVAVKDSLALLPLASALAEPGQTTHDDYWRLPEPNRRELQDRFIHLSDASATPRVRAGREMYEAQQAPVYYVLMAIPYQWLMNWQLADRVMGLRLLTLLLTSLVIPATFVIARRLGGDALGLSSCCVLAAIPQFTMTASRIANDGLAALAVAALVVCMIERRSALWVGLAAGVAMLTKGYLLIVLPAVVTFYFVSWRVDRRPGELRDGLIATVLALLVGGWWYARNLLNTGSLSGEQLEVSANRSMGELTGMAWMGAADFVLRSHLWLGNWSFLVLRSWMYQLMAVGIVASGLMGLVWAYRRWQPLLAMMVCLQASMIAAVMYHAYLTYVAKQFIGTFGHYLDGTIVIEAILIAGGASIFGWRLLVCVLLAMDLFGVHVYLLPYYSGMISHLDSGGLPAFAVSGYAFDGLRTIAERLSVNKGAISSSGWIGLTWAAYWAATAGIVATAIGARNAR